MTNPNHVNLPVENHMTRPSPSRAYATEQQPAKSTVEIVRMKMGRAISVANLMREVIDPLEYYSTQAKEAEIAKYTPSKLRQLCKEDPDSVLIAEVESKTVGFCVSRYDDGLIWLAWFGVRQEHRNHGIGVRLLAALETTVRARGAHKIWCDCRTNNIKSKRVLIDSGFTPFGLARNHWFGHDFILWEKHT